MAKVKLVAESFSEFLGNNINEEASPLNEGLRGSVEKFIKNPEKFEDKFPLFFKDQLKRFPSAVPSVKALSLEQKVDLMKKALEHLKNKPSMDKLQLPLVKDEEGKIKVKIDGDISGAGTRGKTGIHKASGTD